MSQSSCFNSLEQINNDNVTNTQAKRGRGRPAKYSPEERKEKQREAIDKWRLEHKEACRTHRKNFYNENSDQMIQSNIDYQARSRNALRLLTVMLESGELETNKYKDLAFDLVKNKKIIYA